MNEATRFASASEPFDPRDLRRALGSYPTGVAVVTTVGDADRLVGLTCNSFSSVSLSPPLVLWSLSLRSPNLATFLQAPYFAVNVLAADQLAIAQRFAESRPDKFDTIAHRFGQSRVPLIDHVVAQLECRNETRYYSGDHVIFIGHVTSYAYRPCAPLVFHASRYRALVEREARG